MKSSLRILIAPHERAAAQAAAAPLVADFEDIVLSTDADRSVADFDTQRAQGPATFDVGALEALVGDDPTVAREFLIDYRTAAHSAAAEMRAASRSEDTRRIGAFAHKLKSSSRCVGAT